MNKNVFFAYILTYLFNSWFWLPIWILYYLRFTDYGGIGLIESVMIAYSLIAEIPTGAITDMIGKKKALILAMVFAGFGNIFMGMAPTYSLLLASILFTSTGHSFYSGTLEALVYDSLKSLNKENLYDKVIANISTTMLISFAVSSIIGGFLYAINPSYPFFLTGAFMLSGAVVVLFMKEPTITTELDSRPTFSSFFYQMKTGFHELTSSKYHTLLTLFFLLFTFFSIVLYQFLADALLIDFGFTNESLGFAVTLLALTGAGASQLTRYFNRWFHYTTVILATNVIMIITLLISPLLGLASGFISVLVRGAARALSNNVLSEQINKHASSKNRATTLSTYNMLGNLPYVLLAFFLGKAIDATSATTFAAYMGGVMLIALIVQVFLARYLIPNSSS